MVRAENDQRSPLDDVDHLARSPHRVRVMQLLSDEAQSRRGLHETTDIPQPTLGRILGSFQDRHWLERDGQTYSLTLQGRLVAAQFEELLNVVETVQRLPETADLAGLLDLGFEPDWFARLVVVRPDNGDGWFGHIRRARDAVEPGDHLRELAPGPMPGIPESIIDRLRAGELTVESVFTREGFETAMADQVDRRLIRDIVEYDGVSLHLVEDELSCYLARQGDRAVFDLPAGDEGPVTRLTTSDLTVVRWVDSLVNDFLERAEPVSAADLAD